MNRNWLDTRGSMHSNHHNRTQWAQVLARMDLTIILYCKVLSIYRSRNHFTTEMQPFALPPPLQQVPSLVRKDIFMLRVQQHILFCRHEPAGSLGFVQRRLAAFPSKQHPSKRL